MPLPGGVTTVIVHGQIQRADTGAPAVGKVSFAVPQPLRDATDRVILGPTTATVTLDASGSFSIALPATDAAGITPSGWYYVVTVQTDAWTDAFGVQVPTASGPTLEFSAAVPVAVPPTVAIYALSNDPRIVNAVQSTVVTAKGDLIAGTGTAAVGRRPVGSDGQVLTASSASSTGLTWTTPAAATDATTTNKGIVQLAGDLAGTASAPTVPGLASKVSSVTAADSTIVVGGTPTAPTIGVGAVPESKVTGLTTDLAAKAADSAVVHNTGAESIAGVKTFTSAPVVPAGAFPESAVANLTSDLAGKAADSTVVHLAGAETVTGVKTFSSAPVLPAGALPETAVANLTTDLASKTPTSRVISAGTGLTGGGDLTTDRSLAVAYGATSGTAAQGNDSRITGAIQSSTVTAKGDLLAATGSSALTRLPVGSDGQVLTADSTQTAGTRWATPLAIDATVGDIQAVAATAAAGSTGKLADAGHTHVGVTSISVNGATAASGAVALSVPVQTVYNALNNSIAILKGDGTTNDQPALQTLVSALGTLYASDGIPRVIYCPAAVYSMRDSGTVWKSGVSLVGDGPGATRFKLGNPVNTTNPTPLASYTSAFDGASTSAPLVDCTFARFEVDGSGVSLASYSTGAKALVLQYMIRARFSELHLHDCGATALGCDFLQDSVIDRVVAVNNGRLNNGSQPGGAGIGIGIGGWGSVERTTVSNCIVRGNSTHGIFVELQNSAWTRPRGIRIVGCHSEGNRYGVSDWGADGLVVSACTLINNLQHGYYVAASGVGSTGGQGGIVIGCTIDGNAVDGVSIGDTPGKYAVRNNRISGNGRYGIRTANVVNASTVAVVENSYVDNDVYSNGLDGIRTDCTATDVFVLSNRIRNNGQQQSSADSGSGGTVTYSALTITDTAKTWTVNGHAGKLVTVGAQTAIVTSNTATALTLWPYAANQATAWSSGTPSAGTAYSLPAAPTKRAGITLAGNTSHPTLRGNRCWDNQGAQTQTHGWWVTSTAACTGGTIDGNDFLGNLTGSFQFDVGPTGGYAVHNPGMTTGQIASTSNLVLDGSELIAGKLGIGGVSPTSVLQVSGPLATAVVSKTGAYTLGTADSTVLADATSAAFTVTLPTAVGCTGRIYTIKKVDSTANAVTIATTSSQTIDGATTKTLLPQYATYTVQSDGSNWQTAVSPPTSGMDQPHPLAGYGLVAATDTPEIFGGNSGIINDGTVWITRLWVPAGASFSKIAVAVRTGGTYSTSSVPNRLGWWNDSGTLQDQTPDDSTVWATSQAWYVGTLTTPVPAQGAGRFVYTGFIAGGFTSVSAAWLDSKDADVLGKIPGATRRRTMYRTGQTALPTTFDPTAYGNFTNYAPLMGLQ